MEIRTSSLNFPSIRGNGPQQRTAAIRFPRDVLKATAALNGYTTGFAQSGGDHHLGNAQIILNTTIDGNLVNVDATFGLRDWSGNWDDDYEGVIQFTVFAELVSPTATPPRGDLLIADMEFTQAIQYFRSDRHLDPANVRPDNSIRMVARKDTGVRVYVDYDSASGLTVINRLSGELTVISGGSQQVIFPFAAIQPRRDAQIQRALTEHTLNFAIPGDLCQGLVTLRCQVFDQANPSARSSMHESTLLFVEREPLNIYAVGIHYTGQGLNLTAPTLGDITPMLEYTELTYPVPEAFVTGYTEIEFSADLNANIADGCGSGYNELLGDLRDMRGNSHDLYYGFLPLGFNGGSVGGCGDNGVGASPFDDVVAVAHEAGHALGRKHAPCDSAARCNNPANQDGDFPKYNGFASDSIGEFGYNVHNNTVFDPAISFDFMGYSRGNMQWISPYTYNALFSALPSSEGIGTEGFSARMEKSKIPQRRKTYGEWQPVQTMQLMLDLTIDREHKVERRHAFHFLSSQPNGHGHASSYSAELTDEKGNTLTCQKLLDSSQCCSCCADCYPKRFYQSIPFSKKARKLIIRHGDEVIYEESIHNAPELFLKTEYVQDGKFYYVEWQADVIKNQDMRYIVQWQDSNGTWRGFAPRSAQNNVKIPVQFLGRRKTMVIRVLASSGIATGVAEGTLELQKYEPGNADILIVGQNPDTNEIPTVLVIKPLKVKGEIVRFSDYIWYDDQHAEIGRGKSLNLNKLGQGQHMLRAVILDTAGGKTEKSWLIERRDDGKFYLFNGSESSK